MGPKPSITITVKNAPTDNYLIDLLIYDNDGKKYEGIMDYNGADLTEEQQKSCIILIMKAGYLKVLVGEHIYYFQIV